MKKIILIILLTSIGQIAYSQILIGLLFGDKLNNEKLEFGLNVSGNNTTISNSNNQTGFKSIGFGLYLDYKITDKLYFQTGFSMLDTRGIKKLTQSEIFKNIPDTLFNISQKAYRKIKYLTAPISIAYRHKSGFGLYFGGAFSMLLRANDILEARTQNELNILQIGIRDDISRFNIDGFIGLSYHFKGKNGAQLRFDYSYGLMNVYTGNNNSTGYFSKTSLQLLIPIKFEL